MFKLLFLPVRIIRLFLKLAGVRGVLLLAVGVGIGLLIAPQKGAQLRAQLQQRVGGITGAPDRITSDIE